MKNRTSKKSVKRAPAKRRNRTVIKAKKVKVIANTAKRAVKGAKRRTGRNPQYTLEARPDARVRAMTHEFKVPTKTLANLAMRGYVQEQGGGNPNAYSYKLTKLGLARWRVEAKPKIKAARSTVKAFTAGSATRKFKRSLSGPKSSYQISVERNPKQKLSAKGKRIQLLEKKLIGFIERYNREYVFPAREHVLRGHIERIQRELAKLRGEPNSKRRNPDFYTSAVELLRKMSGGTAFTRLTVADVTKALERKGYSRDRIRKGLTDLARADEITLFREDDNLAITPEDKKFAFAVGGQQVHRIRVARSIGQSGASQRKKRQMPVGWTQGSVGFQKASRKKAAKKAAKPKRPLTKVEEEYAKLLKEAGIDYEPNPKRRRNSSTSDFALAGRISRAIAALERKPETAIRKAQIKKLQSYLAKVYQRAEAQRQAEAAAIYAAPRSFASSRKGGSVRKKKNPTFQEMLAGKGTPYQRIFAESVMGFARASHPDPAMVANLIDLGLKAGLTPPAIKRLLARKKGTKTAIRLVNARMQQLQRRGDLDSYRAASKNPRRRQNKAASKKRNPSPVEIRKEFAGRYNKDSELLFPLGTPKGLAKLGKLLLIKCESGPIRPVKGTVWLCSDTKGKLHIGTTKADATSLFSGPKASLGEISRIEYDESKPHLGYVNRTIFFHKMGEENGIRPRLVADGKGGLLIKGGDYRIRREGIVN